MNDLNSLQKKTSILFYSFILVGGLIILFTIIEGLSFWSVILLLMFFMLNSFLLLYCKIANKYHELGFSSFITSIIVIVSFIFYSDPSFITLLFLFVIPAIASFFNKNTFMIIFSILSILIFNYFMLVNQDNFLGDNYNYINLVHFNLIFLCISFFSSFQIYYQNSATKYLAEVSQKLSEQQEEALENNLSLMNTNSSLKKFGNKLNKSISVTSDSSKSIVSELSSMKNSFSELNESLYSTTYDLSSVNSDVDSVFESAKNVSYNIDSNKELLKKTDESIEKLYSSMQSLDENFDNTLKETVALKGKVDEIEFIVQFIKDITKKINLLALNASIEAVKSGKDGNGFKVVADEVKKLAEQSSDSTKEISDILKLLQHMMLNVSEKVSSSKNEIQSNVELSSDVKHSFDILGHNNDFVNGEVSSIFEKIELLHKTTRSILDDLSEVESSYKINLDSLEEIFSKFNEINTSISLIKKDFDDIDINFD